jgi:hypothetical protein
MLQPPKAHEQQGTSGIRKEQAMNGTDSDRKLLLLEGIRPFQGMLPFGPIASGGKRHNVIYLFPLVHARNFESRGIVDL